MTRPVAVLRPEPGNTRTVERLAAEGLTVARLPLFAVEPIDWLLPPGRFDALIVTSANAIRHAGARLAALAHLPVFAVGRATAEVAQTAGLTVGGVGEQDAAAALALARAAGAVRPLHLAGMERVALPTIDAVAVYASRPVPIARAAVRALEGHVVLLHSARAAAAWAEHVDRAELPRASVRIAALSEAVAGNAGSNWAALAAADRPNDEALVALALRLASTRAD